MGLASPSPFPPYRQPPPGTATPFLGTAAVSLHGGAPTPGKRAGSPRARRGRFELLRVAQRILYTRGASKQARTCWCHRSITTKFGRVGVYRQQNGGGARFSGVSTCGAVWTCPVCAAKIAEHRRRELSAAMVKALGMSLHAYLLTLTFPHSLEDQLSSLLERQAKALQSFKNSRRYKNFMKAHGRAGSVRSLEVTYGVNAWHPHTHDLIFALPGALEERAGLRRLRGAWLRSCFKAGLIKPDGTLSPFRNFWKHSLDLRGGERAAEYIAKYGRDERWGASSEMTAAHAKVGIRRAIYGDAMHFTPFQLLEWAKNGDGDAAALFREYAEAFEGKRMLSWSPKLKKTLGVDELTDEELAGGVDADGKPIAPLEPEQFVATLERDQYGVLLARNALGEFLEFVAECCADPEHSQDAVNVWVEVLERERPPGYSSVARTRSVLGEGGWAVEPLDMKAGH